MAKDKKKNKKNTNAENKKAEDSNLLAQVPAASEIEVKPEAQTSQTLSSLPKTQEAVTQTKLQQPVEISAQVKPEQQKNNQPASQPKNESDQNQVAHEEPQRNQNQCLIENNNQKVQIPDNEDITAQLQPEVRLFEQEVRQQQASQPLWPDQISNTAPLQVDDMSFEKPAEVVVQRQVEQQIPKNLNILETQVLQNQVNSVPNESQPSNKVQVQNQPSEAISDVLQERQAEIPPQRKLDDQLLPTEVKNTETFVQVQQKQQQIPQSQTQNLNLHPVQVTIEREQQNVISESNAQKIQTSCKDTINELVNEVSRPFQLQSQAPVNVVQQNNYTEKATEQIQEKKQPSFSQMPEPEKTQNINEIPPVSPQETPQKVVLQSNPAQNIQILEYSTKHQVEIIRQPVQNSPENQSNCLSESVQVQNLEQSQYNRLEQPAEDQKIQIIAQAISVYENSTNILDINQPIELIPSVQQPQAVNNQNQQSVVERREVEDRIFTLVQSSEVAVETEQKQVRAEFMIEVPQTQVNVVESQSFSELNYSVEKSIGNEHKLESIPQQVQNKLSQLDNGQSKFQAVEVIKQAAENEIKQVQRVQLPQQPVSIPVQILDQEKVVVVESQPEKIRAEPPSQAIQILVENTSEIPIKIDISVEVLKQIDSKNSQQLSNGNKDAIIVQERPSSPIPTEIEESQVILDAPEKPQEKQQQKKENTSSLGSKLMISSASFVLVGGINWALTKSMHKSLAIGAVVAGGAYAAMKLLKN